MLLTGDVKPEGFSSEEWLPILLNAYHTVNKGITYTSATVDKSHLTTFQTFFQCLLFLAGWVKVTLWGRDNEYSDASEMPRNTDIVHKYAQNMM